MQIFLFYVWCHNVFLQLQCVDMKVSLQEPAVICRDFECFFCSTFFQYFFQYSSSSLKFIEYSLLLQIVFDEVEVESEDSELCSVLLRTREKKY